MSADVLRQAAALMRERATRADASGDGEPWFPADELHALIGAGSRNTADAEHIASWHPAVALAVADWLDAEIHHAEYRERQAARDNEMRLRAEPFPVYYDGHTQRAIDVARAYLGESA